METLAAWYYAHPIIWTLGALALGLILGIGLVDRVLAHERLHMRAKWETAARENEALRQRLHEEHYG